MEKMNYTFIQSILSVFAVVLFSANVSYGQVCTSLDCPAPVMASASAGVCEGAVTVPMATATCSATSTVTSGVSLLQPLGTNTLGSLTIGADAVPNGVATVVLLRRGDVDFATEQHELFFELNASGVSTSVLTTVGADVAGQCQAAFGPGSVSNFTVNPNDVIDYVIDPTNTGVGTFCALPSGFPNDYELLIVYPIVGAAPQPAITNSFNGTDDASDTYPVGTTSVTFSAPNGLGGTISCATTVTVTDDEAPVFTSCPMDLLFDLLPGECDVVVTYSVVMEDNCSPIVIPDLNNLTVFDGYPDNNITADEVGSMFDIENVDAIATTITELAIKMRSGTWDLELYATTGDTWNGIQNNVAEEASNADWEFLGKQTVNVAANYDDGVFSLATPLTLAPGESKGFFFVVDDVVGLEPIWYGFFNPASVTDGVVEIRNGIVKTNNANPYGAGQFGPVRVTHVTVSYAGLLPPVTQVAGPVSGDIASVGTTTVRFEGMDAAGNPAVPCEFDITVTGFSGATTTLACNDNVQVSLDENGCTLVNADVVLEGGPYGCYTEDYTITRTPTAAGCPAPTSPGEVYFGCGDVGRTVTVRVTDNATGSSCWGTVTVEDKLDPTIECRDAIITCTESVDPIPAPAIGTYSSILTPGDIIENGAGTSPRIYDFDLSSVPAGTPVMDVNVRLKISGHTWLPDLNVELIDPTGNAESVFTIGGCVNQEWPIDCVLDDDGGLITLCNQLDAGGAALQPLAGGVSQATLLSNIEGTDASGLWQLRVTDGAAGDDGVIDEIGLIMEINVPQADPADNCAVVDLSYIEADATGTCANGIAQVITRTWTAVDASGNAASCEQTITVTRPGLGDVVWPEGVTYLDCSSDYPTPGTEVCVKDTMTIIDMLGLGLPDGPHADFLPIGSFDLDAAADDSRTIKDMNVRIELTHGDINEAQVAIARLDLLGNIIPGSQVILFTADVNDGYVQCSNNLMQNFDIIFDDEGCAMPHEPCVDFAPSVEGQFQPYEALSLYDGQLVNAHAGADFIFLYRDLEGMSPTNTTNGTGILQDIEITYLYQDADVVTTPTISGGSFTAGDICGLTSTYTDERIDVCPTSYKIIRTWTVIDWCSGDKETRDELLKVVDTCPPVINTPRTANSDRFTLDVNVYVPSVAANGAHHVCMGNATLPPLDICSENCSGVDAASWQTRLYSADGNDLLGVANGNGGSFTDLILDLDEGATDDVDSAPLTFPDLSTPFPFDSITIPALSTLKQPDAIYLAVYTVADNCGNTAEANVYVRLIDRIPPVPVIREETQISLTGGIGDTTTLCASDLDEGSYDNCGGTHFFIRKMVDDNDNDPIGNVDFGFGPDPTLTFEIFGRDGAGSFKLARDFVYKACTSFTCDDIGTDNQVFVLVVDDYVINFMNQYLDDVFPFIDAIVDYNQVPLTVLPADKIDDEEDIFTTQPNVVIQADNDARNRGQRFFEFYLNEDPRADGLFVLPTAIIWEGHYNFAMVNVHVEDKVRPECEAPEDVWTTCDKLPDNIDFTDTDALDDLFGTATGSDNCNYTVEERNPNVDVDLCGVGQIVRNWQVEDDYGNRSLGSCRQTIMIMPVNEYTIDIPGDFEEECDDASPRGLTYEEIGCDLLAVNVEDEEFPASTLGECKKILRTYKVINWCEYDGFSQPTDLPRADLNNDGRVGDGYGGSNNSVTGVNYNRAHRYTSDGTTMVRTQGNFTVASTGYYRYEQHIKIFDNTAPDVSYDGDVVFCGGDLDEDPCTGLVEIDPDRSDLCTNVTTTWELDAFSATFEEADFDGGGGLSRRLPLGTHTVRFYVEDECGNISHLNVTFEIVDCKAPTPVCHNGLSIDVMPLSGMVELWASDFDASSFDYCNPFELRVNVVEDQNGDGIITSDDYENNLPSTTNIVVDCDDVAAGLTMVQLWVAEQDGDADDAAADNQDNDYCVTFVEVQDNNGVCGGSKVALGGKVANEDGESVELVTVDINNGSSSLTSSVVTDASGDFNFINLPLGGDYTVTPMRMDDVDNGVSTFDLIQISRHILNVELLDSPYKIIAADANNSANISTVDLVAIRKVILKVADEFPNNTSWRFVDKDYIFANAAQPLKENFKEVINRNNMDSDDFAADFVAIKVGDVNGDATPNSILGVDGRTFNGNLVFTSSEQSVEAGEEFTVEFTAASDVTGYQFTMNYNENAVELVDIVDGLAKEAANFNVLDGKIATSWNEDAATAGQVMFSLVFQAKEAIAVSNALSVSSSVTAAEAYNAAGDLLGISLEFDGADATTEFELSQNTPNPFKAETVIGFTLPEASNATLTISDATGKILKVVTGDYAQGYNQVSLKRADIGVATGVLSYRLDTPNNTATKQMIVIE